MTRFFQRTRTAWLLAGVFAAALIGGMLSDVAKSLLNPTADDHPLAGGFFKAMNVHATATNSSEAMIIATGEIDTAVEGIFSLDPLTGELRGAVLSPALAKFVAKYSYPSVAKDFEGAKNPKFLMVTGIGELRKSYGPGARAAHCIIYVAEATSGRVVAYGVPWDSTKAASPKGFVGALVPLDAFNARDTAVRN
jgi:hypothetical protein